MKLPLDLRFIGLTPSDAVKQAVHTRIDQLERICPDVMAWRVTADEFRGIKGHDLDALGIPQEAPYVEAYRRRTGRESLPDWDYYLAFNMFRMAAILQGILARAIQGNATSSEAVATGRRARPMAAAGWRLVEGLSAGPTATAAGAVRP